MAFRAKRASWRITPAISPPSTKSSKLPMMLSRPQSAIGLETWEALIISQSPKLRRSKEYRTEVVSLDVNNPYKKISGGSLDQALFKKRGTQSNTVSPSLTEQ